MLHRRLAAALARRLACLCIVMCLASAAYGQAASWDLAALSKPPREYPAPDFKAEGVRALFYDGLPWKGKPSRVFAWYGAPERRAGDKFPAMVLVHGGGGTAFDDWVRLWNSRGYAAISMDTCGCTAGGQHNKRPRHDTGGPPGWGGYDQVSDPIQDQWMYHAVADGILATSLLSSYPEVDAGRIGITGISWGGIVTCIVAGVDTRLKFAAPVYGCGFLGENPGWQKDRDAAVRQRWRALWDPSHFLPAARMPMLWVDGTNDFAFPLPSVQKSYRLAPGERTLAIRVNMVHGQREGAAPEEIAAFADHFLKGKPPLARVTGQGADGKTAWATFKSERPVARAEFNYTCDKGEWKQRKWQTAPADLRAAEGKVSAPLPDGVAAYYFNLIDDRGLIVSSEHVEP
jgi:dienelactone hydrolase